MCGRIPLASLTDVAVVLISHHIHCDNREQAKLRTFSHTLFVHVNANSEILFTAITYIRRYFAQARSLHVDHGILPYALFLSAFSLAFKYASDERAPPNSTQWAQASGNCFSARQISALERRLLEILAFNLRVDDAETQYEWACVAEHLGRCECQTGNCETQNQEKVDNLNDSGCLLSIPASTLGYSFGHGELRRNWWRDLFATFKERK
ncbi:hypothetical protein BC830DRAFT_1080017 [Chytriomyces sp. MP71]|nr:hypothetical protein BC830DRAFT_1080017 [Chytriomyces sp. MP71]